MRACTCVCVYVCARVHVCTHTHTPTQPKHRAWSSETLTDILFFFLLLTTLLSFLTRFYWKHSPYWYLYYCPLYCNWAYYGPGPHPVLLAPPRPLPCAPRGLAWMTIWMNEWMKSLPMTLVLKLVPAWIYVWLKIGLCFACSHQWSLCSKDRDCHSKLVLYHRACKSKKA